MMVDIFLTILNMSIAASWIVLVVVVLRRLLKDSPKWIRCALWGIVGVRLVIPFSFESIFSLLPSAKTLSKQASTAIAHFQSGIDFVDNPVNNYIKERYMTGITITNPMKSFTSISTIVSIIWIIGILALVMYSVVSYVRLKHKIRTAVILKDNIYQCETVETPFVLGLMKPRIYLPFEIKEQDMAHVILHEEAHVIRKDHWWKALGFYALTVHWFNPIIWLGYVLFCHDIELACDEKVVKDLNQEQRADYSQALLACSLKRHTIAACPIAFGEMNVKNRIKSVLTYKKPTVLLMRIGVIVCIVIAICFLTNPMGSKYKTIANTFDIYEGEEYELIVGNLFDSRDIYTLYNHSSNEIETGVSYILQIKIRGQWRSVYEDGIFSALYSQDIPKNGNRTWLTGFEYTYGDLPAGKYRIVKEVDTNKGKIYVAEEFKIPRFEISNGKKKQVSESEAIEIVKKYYELFEGEKKGILNYDNPEVEIVKFEDNLQVSFWGKTKNIAGKELYKITFHTGQDGLLGPEVWYVQKDTGEMIGRGYMG